MRNIVWLALATLCIAVTCAALEPDDYAFLLSASGTESPARIILTWAQNPSYQIFIRRKLPTDTAWGPVIANLPGGTTSFIDPNVQLGVVYEYQVAGILTQTPDTQMAYGYIAAGINVSAIERRGKVLLLVDRTHSDALANELETLRLDLIGDGWTVLRRDVWPTDPVPQIKSLVQAEYNADPANMRAVFLIGHVPVPYSGNIAPDMHETHRGAWPADVYYGVLNGDWTDYSVNQTAAEFEANDNIPGDGKFDQSTTPAPVQLEVGRIDFADLPAFGARTERDLLRNYLNKDHRFRTGQIPLPLRGLIRDEFRVISEDAPAADAWRAFPALFGPNGAREVGSYQFFPTLASDGYLWAYGGGGGDFTKADGVGTTADFVNNDPKCAFYLLHGSYFGDWNTQDNFLRAALGTSTYGVVSIWSSLPHWYFHHLAMGETIGYATRLVQNNRGLYVSQKDYSFAEVHISMMGDPTLHPFVVAPPSNVRISAADKVTIAWDPSPQAVDGYILYRAPSVEGPYTRLTRGVVSTTTIDQTLPLPGNYVYMVRACATQTTGSGTFDNLSEGVFVPYTQGQAQAPEVNVAAIDSVGDESGDYVVFEFTRNGDTTSPLAVSVKFSGTASEGSDYPAIGGTISFAAGSASSKLTIYPTADNVNELDETIIATILPSTTYTIGASSNATATILANGQSQILTPTLTNTGVFTFTATGFANRAYRVESRPPDGAWLTRTNATSGADGSVTYRETIPATAGAQFYRLVWE